MSVDTVPVRRPDPGEIMYLWPLEPRPGWFQIHDRFGEVYPHLAGGCWCEQLDGPIPRPTWEAFLLCRLRDRPGNTTVIRFGRSSWLTCDALKDNAFDLRDYKLCLHRRRLSGRMSAVFTATKVGRDGRWNGNWWPNSLSYLLQWWTLPATDPAYRQRVYDEAKPRLLPSLDSPYLPLEPCSMEDCS